MRLVTQVRVFNAAYAPQSVSSPQDKSYAERSCGLRDSFGNTWYVSTFKG
jgi:uncharacterized glyoxalase superfamily protein PhnB